MKIKQTKFILATILFAIATAVGFAGLGTTQTTLAYKCQGGDYYDAEKRECWSFKDVTQTTVITDAQGRERTVKSCPAAYDHKDPDGTCWATGGEKKNYAPLYDDGTSVQSDAICEPYNVTGVGAIKTNFDANEYTCKVDKSDCLAKAGQSALGHLPVAALLPILVPIMGSTQAQQCLNGKVAPTLPEKDPTVDCLKNGGVFEHNGDASKCTFTAESCKAKGKKLNKEEKGCEDLNECDKKYPNANQKAEYDECIAAMDNPNQDCSKKATEALKKACELGQLTAPEAFDSCGEAQTVLIKCSGESGVPIIANVLRIAIVVLSTIIGIAAVGGLAWASILYAKAEDNEGNTKEAKELIRNIVIGLLLYGFLIAIINWLVPGGVIGGGTGGWF